MHILSFRGLGNTTPEGKEINTYFANVPSFDIVKDGWWKMGVKNIYVKVLIKRL